MTGAATSSTMPDPPTDAVEVRARIVDALKLDLVGPWAGHALADEQLPTRERPANWYVAGFLIPTDAPPDKRSDADADEDLDAVPGAAGLAEESNDERKAARKAFFPSSMGLTFLVPAACRTLAVTVRWGDYVPADVEDAAGNRTTVWQRIPRAEPMSIPLEGAADPVPHGVPDSEGLELNVVERPILAGDLTGELLPAGTRSVSCSLVNGAPPTAGRRTGRTRFRPRSKWRRSTASCRGPTCAACAQRTGTSRWRTCTSPTRRNMRPATAYPRSGRWWTASAGSCARPGSAAPRWRRRRRPGCRTSSCPWRRWGRWPTARTRRGRLAPLVARYRDWIAARREAVDSGPLAGTRRDTAAQLLNGAGIAADRIERGIAMLAADADLLDAFRVANRAVARALRQRLGNSFAEARPSWRPFQLAFMLLNLPGLADPRDPHRETVDLLFFPPAAARPRHIWGWRRWRWCCGACATRATAGAPAPG